MRGRAAVFCFHDLLGREAIADVPVGHRPYVLEPAEFRARLEAIRTTGRRPVSVTDLVHDWAGGTVALTFDDGRASDYTDAFPVLRELGFRATFFVIAGLVDTPGHVTWAQLREMVASGMEVGSHSMTHPFMDALDPDGVAREFGESKTLLEARLGCPVRAASLPRGSEPREFRRVLAQLGYRAFCTSRVGWWYPGSDALLVPRVAVRRGMPIETVAAIAAGEPRALMRMQAVEAAKNVVKRCIGRRGWSTLRAPILALREHL
jgi:peptidoglycan/xylan/chitin deacetylase (PgdA/CDA1 family)